MLYGGGRHRGSERRDWPCPGLIIEVPAMGGGRSSRLCTPGRGLLSCMGPEQEEHHGSQDQEGYDTCDNNRQEIRSGNNKVDGGSTPLRFSV